MSMATPDAETEKCGIPCLLKDCNRRGACPEHARERSIRLLANRPQLHEERSAVIATNVPTPAAAAKPSCCNTRTNGLCAGPNRFDGNSIIRTASEPTQVKLHRPKRLHRAMEPIALCRETRAAREPLLPLSPRYLRAEPRANRTNP